MARADVRGRRRNLSAEAGRRGDEQSGFRSGEVRKRIEYAMMLREKGISIREENPEDRRTIGRVVERAFRAEERSDHREYLLVERLRGSEAFVGRFSALNVRDPSAALSKIAPELRSGNPVFFLGGPNGGARPVRSGPLKQISFGYSAANVYL